MRPAYSGGMSPRQPLPNLWLLSDRRNDAALEQALAALPHGSGFVFRHYHLAHEERRERFQRLAALCREAGHLAVLSGDADTARGWGAQGMYGPPGELVPGSAPLRFATVHDAHEIALANRAGVDAMFLSPVYPTRSHPEAAGLGKAAFLDLAALATAPVIALGGMTAARAAELGWARWAAIDGLS